MISQTICTRLQGTISRCQGHWPRGLSQEVQLQGKGSRDDGKFMDCHSHGAYTLDGQNGLVLNQWGAYPTTSHSIPTCMMLATMPPLLGWLNHHEHGHPPREIPICPGYILPSNPMKMQPVCSSNHQRHCHLTPSETRVYKGMLW